MQLTGIHHLTAITSDATRNHQFYVDQLGLRLVKKTVNQDDTSAYHLFYADGIGSPGSDITFFEWPVPPGSHGRQSISGTSFRIPADSLDWWHDHFRKNGISCDRIVKREGRNALDFTDFEGQRLTLVADGAGEGDHIWKESPVPPAHQIKGLGPIALTIASLAPTETVLTEVLNMKKKYDRADPDITGSTTHVYEMGRGGPAAELHLVVQPDLPLARQGAGSVHHVAFRIPDSDYDHWVTHLNRQKVPSSGPVDRYYFRSLYFREPNGILFEIATDGPGFDADEPIESLGKSLALPPFLEHKRAQIESKLKPIG